MRWTTDAWIAHPEPEVVELMLRTTVENRGKRKAPVSLLPPKVTVSVTAAPGPVGEEFLGIGIRGEGAGSDTCSSAHGGPATLRPGDRHTTERSVELDPLPWPRGQAFEVAVRVRDCRPGRLHTDIAALLVRPPEAPGDLPTVQLAPER